MEYIYDKIISNNLNEKDKQQLKIVLERYNNRLQKYKDIVDKASQKPTPEEKTNKDIKVRTRGRPKQQYTEEEIEALKHKNKILQKNIMNIILKKENFKKQNGLIIIEH